MTRLRSLLLAVLALALVAAPAADAQKKKVPLLKLESGATEIVPDLGFVSALQGLNVAPSVLPPGEATADGFAFPIVTGKLAGNKPAAGQIRHFGGLRISAADGTHVDLNNFRINDGKNRAAVTTQAGDGPRIVLAKLDLSDATIRLSRKAFVLSNVGLLLSANAATALNAQFATTAFQPGQLLGVANVAAKIKLKLKTFET